MVRKEHRYGSGNEHRNFHADSRGDQSRRNYIGDHCDALIRPEGRYSIHPAERDTIQRSQFGWRRRCVWWWCCLRTSVAITAPTPQKEKTPLPANLRAAADPLEWRGSKLGRLLRVPDATFLQLLAQRKNVTWRLLAVRTACIRS